MRTRLSIGEFAAMAHLSVKTLRRYHDSGLLDPAEVDGATGYRYYAPEQIRTAQAIRRLRELDMPEREIAGLLSDPDDDTRRELLAGHLRRLEDRLERTRESVAALRRLLHPDRDIVVRRRTAAASTVAAITGVVAHHEVLTWYAAAMTELDTVLSRHNSTPTGPPGSLIAESIFVEEPGALTVHLPVTHPPLDARVAPLTIPAAELATAIHRGSHADIDITYGQVAHWFLTNNLRPAGPVRETYLIGPRDTPRESEWQTEVGLPIA
jgi:DNA-binding transcriptional MerR regulator